MVISRRQAVSHGGTHSGTIFLFFILAYYFPVTANTFLIFIIDEETAVAEYGESHGQAACLHTHNCAAVIHLQIRDEHLHFKAPAIFLFLFKANADLSIPILIMADDVKNSITC